MAGYTDRLHTSSYYVIGEGDLKPKNYNSFVNSGQSLLYSNIDKIYQQLREKELNFYKQFGYNSADEFYTGIKQIIKESERDFKILDNFSSSNIKQSLQKFQNYLEKTLQEAGIINISFKCKENPGEKILRELQKISSSNVTYINGELSLGFEWSSERLKQIINIAQNKRYKTKNNNLKGVFDYIKSNPDMIVLSTNGTEELPAQEIQLRDSIFNYSQSEIEKMDKNQIEDLRNKILDFLEKDLQIGSGSGTLQIAANKVINATIMPKLTDLTFFAGGSGSGWIDKTVGALGEFRAAVFFEYLAMKCPNKNLADHITEIIGNKTGQNSQQYHSDLQILESFGIQVKNYNNAFLYNGTERTVRVALHPMEVSPLMEDEEMVSYIINSYFNASIPAVDTGDLQSFFEANALELLNLDLPTNIQVPARVSFYLVGNSLIPGSEIIRNGFLKKDKLVTVSDTTIQGKTGYTDLGYIAVKNSDGDAKFTDWWHGSKQTGWTPTSDNNLMSWDKWISIRTTFTYSTFWESGAFDIF